MCGHGDNSYKKLNESVFLVVGKIDDEIEKSMMKYEKSVGFLKGFEHRKGRLCADDR